jgi:adenosylcobinamide-GDP ribazoletransferase
MRRVAPWTVVVGALIGASIAGVFVGLGRALPPFVSAVIATGFGMLLTGGLHEDGFADVADGFGAGVDRERTLEIMKDPRLGTYGVAALTLALLIRVSAVATMSPKSALVALIVAHSVSRGTSLLVLGSMSAAIDTGTGASFIRELERRGLAVATVISVTISVALIGAWSAVALPVALFSIAALRLLSTRKIGGVTGDVFGAGQLLAELSILLVATAVGPTFVARWIG